MQAIHDLLALKPTLVRGNASEISALVDSSVKSRGVDSVLESQNAVEAGIKLAFRYDTIVVITGFSDYVGLSKLYPQGVCKALIIHKDCGKAPMR